MGLTERDGLSFNLAIERDVKYSFIVLTQIIRICK
jgi:hypothetical protein